MNPFDELHRQMDALVNSFFSGAELPWFAMGRGDEKTFYPTFEIAETDKEYHVSAELPGLTEKDIEINLEDNILTIKGEKKEEKDEKKKNYHLYERRYGLFNRSFTLPENVDQEKINANIKNGVLEILIPKKEIQKKTAKKIEVKGK